MPAKLLRRVAEEGTFSHVYNNGVENIAIFKDRQDYEVFLGYLRDYLSPASSEISKKEFTIEGRSFQGTPRQPKNYLGKVELIAYRLTPTRFHLILHQNTPDSLANFIRSLCTRYSIYFNKKYSHTGALFNGPYKSIHIKGVSQLLHSTRYLHRSPDNGEDPIKIYTSYPEYLGQRESSWVKTGVVLSVKGIEDYKDFVEKYQLNQEEKDLLGGIPIDGKKPHLENIVHTVDAAPVSSDETTAFPAKTPPPDLKPRPRIFEYGLATGIFVVLLSFGMNNVRLSQAKHFTNSPVLSESTGLMPSPTPTPTPTNFPEPKIMVTVKTDASASANIRKEPSLQSEIIGTAENGEVFESVSIGPEWNEIKLNDGSIGFILSKLIQMDQTNN